MDVSHAPPKQLMFNRACCCGGQRSMQPYGVLGSGSYLGPRTALASSTDCVSRVAGAGQVCEGIHTGDEGGSAAFGRCAQGQAEGCTPRPVCKPCNLRSQRQMHNRRTQQPRACAALLGLLHACVWGQVTGLACCLQNLLKVDTSRAQAGAMHRCGKVHGAIVTASAGIPGPAAAPCAGAGRPLHRTHGLRTGLGANLISSVCLRRQLQHADGVRDAVRAAESAARVRAPGPAAAVRAGDGRLCHHPPQRRVCQRGCALQQRRGALVRCIYRQAEACRPTSPFTVKQYVVDHGCDDTDGLGHYITRKPCVK